MKCARCGFAASAPTVGQCPFCKGVLSGTIATAGHSALATTQQKYGLSAAEAYERQLQVGILMVLSAYACDLLGAFLLGFVPGRYAAMLCAAAMIGSLPLHFRGFAHCAESKGYPRQTGWLLGLLGPLGALILWRMADRTKIRG